MTRLVLFCAALGIGVLILGRLIQQQLLLLPGPLDEKRLVYIKQGSSIGAIAEQLSDEGVIDFSWPFELEARLFSGAGGLKAGEYEIDAETSASDVLVLLQSGKVYRRKITIPEGLMSVEIVDLLKGEEVLAGDISAIPPEGSLLPETYDYIRGDTREGIIKRMQRAMDDVRDKLWEGRDQNIPVQTWDEAVNLASIVEKETGMDGERAKVAGVFVNRLKIGMPLQSDPTVIYAVTLGKMKLDRPILRSDLNLQSPYNTYLVRGLPPTPIANPGKEALSAVLHPEAHDYLYFVADGTGGHAFSKSLSEHTRNVSKWRKIENRQ